MKERAYNLYVFVSGEFVTEIGAVEHEILSDEQTPGEMLRSLVQDDVLMCQRFPIPARYKVQDDQGKVYDGVLRYKKYVELAEIGMATALFEEVFEYFQARRDPMICVTPVVDGHVTIEGYMPVKNTPIAPNKVVLRDAPDYLSMYMNEGNFDAGQLITDDFLKPVVDLFRSKRYVSCMKLLLSAIDSFAFLEFGDQQGNFTKWLERFIDLAQLGVTSDEIWELRNSLLHMTNYESRKVVAGKVSRITLAVGSSIAGISNETFDGKFLLVNDFFLAVELASERWLKSIFNEGKVEQFIARYDLIVSESRLGRVEFE